MVEELKVDVGFRFRKGSPDEIRRFVQGLGITVSGNPRLLNVQSIGISEEAIALGEVSSLGVMYAKNLDGTNYLEIRSGTGASNDVIKLKPGEAWVWRWGSDVTAPYAIANTATCLLEYALFSD